MVQTLQNMFNGSIEVLTKPSVATFEKHERDDLGNALIYVAIGAVISGVLNVVSFFTNPPELGGQEPSLIGNVTFGVLGALIGFLIYTGIVYGLGRAFGGTGKFGELTYDISLFSVPFTVATSLVNIIPFIGWILSLILLGYNLFLTYLGIQAGMNLPKDKALYVIGILLAIGIVLFLCFAVAIGGMIALLFSGSGS